MAKATVTGALSDIGVSAFPELKPRLIFTLSGPAVESAAGSTRVFATKPLVVAVNAGSGIFTVDLQTTTNLRPAAWYNVRIEWLDPAGGYVSADFLEWELFVPSGGGNFADLIKAPVNPMLYWVAAIPPKIPQPGQHWLNTATSLLTKWTGSMWVEVADVKGQKGDKGDVDPTQATRFEMLEGLIAEDGSRVENLAIDPMPFAAGSATYSGGRVDRTQVGARGRATCNAVGATSLYAVAGLGGGPESRYAATAGTKVAARVALYGHPTQDMGATLILNGYTWDGSAFTNSATATGISSGQIKVPAGGSVVIEFTGTLPAGDITHVLPTLTFRRWAETYPQVGDYIEWAEWAVQTGPTAASATPVVYTDGSKPGGYWLGEANLSASVALSARTDPNQGALTRDMLVSAFKARRGGVIGTNKAAVALRFDHWLTNFVPDIYPHLVRLGLPWAQVQNPDTIGNVGNNGWTYAQLQDAAIASGGEVVNHGGNHLDAVGIEQLRDQITGSLARLKAGLPKLAIESWAPPGLAAPAYGGYSPMQTVENHTGTFAGRLILANHASVSGYVGGVYRPLNGELAIGQVHYVMDQQTASTVDAVIRGTINARAGIVLMIHPNYLGQPGYMTKADLVAVLENIAARRDAGEIEVLTLTGLGIANASTDDRDNLLLNGRFVDGLNSWANTTGWTTETVNGLTYATTSNGTPLTQNVSFTRSPHLLGGSRELVYKVRATAGAIVRAAATGAGLNASKDITLPASPGWREVRQPLTVPLDFTGSLTAFVGRVSGGAVAITDIRLQAI